MALDVERFASKAVSQIVEHEYRQRHEKDDRLAIFECISFCHELEHPLPKWAMSALAQAAENSWETGYKFFYQALFGAGPPGGPHANPLTARKDKQKRDRVNAAIDVTKEAEYHGDKAYTTVQGILESLGLHRSVETIRTNWTYRGEHGDPPPAMRLIALFELRKLQDNR